MFVYLKSKWIFYNKEGDSANKRLMVGGVYSLMKNTAQFWGQLKEYTVC